MSRKAGSLWRWAGAGVLVAAVLALPVLLGRTEPVTRELLAAAQRQWKAANITSYDMELETSGAMTGRYHVEVRDSELKTLTRNGEPADPAVGQYWTVEGLFRTIAEELDSAEHPGSGAFPENRPVWLRVRCDPRLGFPVKYIREVPGTSLGVEIRVRRLQPKPPAPR